MTMARSCRSGKKMNEQPITTICLAKRTVGTVQRSCHWNSYSDFAFWFVGGKLNRGKLKTTLHYLAGHAKCKSITRCSRPLLS